MSYEKVLDKIRKLFSLASSPNEEEAKTAMAHAQRLMDQYNISVEQVDEDSSVSEYLFTEMFDAAARPAELMGIASILKEFFFVVMMEKKTVKTSQYTYRRSYSMFGKAHNIEIAKQVYDYLSTVYRSLWDEYRRVSGLSGIDNMRTFFSGLTFGLTDRLRRERETRQTDQFALVRISENVMKELNKNRTSGVAKSTKLRGNLNAYQDGYATADRINLQAGTGIPTQPKAIR